MAAKTKVKNPPRNICRGSPNRRLSHQTVFQREEVYIKQLCTVHQIPFTPHPCGAEQLLRQMPFSPGCDEGVLGHGALALEANSNWSMKTCQSHPILCRLLGNRHGWANAIKWICVKEKNGKCMFGFQTLSLGKTLQDVLNEILLPRLQSIRKQQPPKVLFARPENGPLPWKWILGYGILHLFFWRGMFSVALLWCH